MVPLNQHNVEEEERDKHHGSKGEALLMGEVEGAGMKKSVSLVAGHLTSVPSGKTQERISEILRPTGALQRCCYLF